MESGRASPRSGSGGLARDPAFTPEAEESSGRGASGTSSGCDVLLCGPGPHLCWEGVGDTCSPASLAPFSTPWEPRAGAAVAYGIPPLASTPVPAEATMPAVPALAQVVGAGPGWCGPLMSPAFGGPARGQAFSLSPPPSPSPCPGTGAMKHTGHPSCPLRARGSGAICHQLEGTRGCQLQHKGGRSAGWVPPGRLPEGGVISEILNG